MQNQTPDKSGQASAEIEITPEMIEAGVVVLRDSGRLYSDSNSDRLLVQEVCSAMLGARLVR